jgi:hypothetical protein
MSAAFRVASLGKRDAALALLATLMVLAVHAATGFKSLGGTADNDSLLRLVEVRDLLAGQNWFDLHQYRMGPQGGFVMHWSRLVDTPIAAIIVATAALTGSVAIAETVARIAWPALMFGLTVFFTIRAARRFGGDAVALPALITSATALNFLGIYDPGALDHHNIQLMLTMASVSFLLADQRQHAAAALAGICAALTLAIGMETAPYVLVIGLCVAGLFLFGESKERLVARGYGLGFAGASALVFVLTVAPSGWAKAQCDAFSAFQFVLAGLAGAGLAAIASADLSSRTRARRLAALALLGAGLAVVVLKWFPECLAAPYAGLDPRLRELWLDHVAEAQSMFQLIEDKDPSVAARYVTPMVALALMALRLRRGAWRRHDSLVGALLAAAFVVSVWQVRGSTFSIALAVIPLSCWIGKWRQHAETTPTPAASLKMIAVWLVSMNATWTITATAAALSIDSGQKAAAGSEVASCDKAADFTDLAGLPDTTVLATSNSGAPILTYSGHRALAGPYHRNIAGNLLVLDTFMGTPDNARAVIEREHIGLVALCPGSPESRFLAHSAPDGFLAQLLSGKVPAWLEPVAETRGKPLQLYRVEQGG